MMLSTYEIYSRAALRVISAFLFMQHGAQKLFHYPPGGHNQGPLELFSLVGVAGVLEFFGGLCLLVGLCTRSVAFLLSGQMAVAYFMFYPAKAFFPVVNGGELTIMFCFVFFYFIFAGSGAWSIDEVIKNRLNRSKSD
ncbi:DoxX family protein [Marinomonas posidonica]|uniref:DoxX family protein n=1 Tax=Marinomonas posidonica TaxID=936476 RepID=UPI003735BA1D